MKLKIEEQQAAIIFLYVALLLIFKSPDILIRPQLFAEDGVIFFQQQYGHFYPILFKTYAGYLLFIPRSIAWLASLFPYSFAPTIYNTATLFIDTYAITYFATKSNFLASRWIIITALLFAPTNGEMFGTLAYCQWFIQLVLFASVFYPLDHSKKHNKVVTYAVIMAVALTGPFSIFCSMIGAVLYGLHAAMVYLRNRTPLAIMLHQYWSDIDKRRFAIVILCGAIQAGCILLSARYTGATSQFSFPIFADLTLIGFQMHIFGIAILPEFAAAVFLTILVLLVLIHLWQSSDARFLIIISMLLFATLQLAGVSSQKFFNTLVSIANFNGDRYYFFMKILFWILMNLLYEALHENIAYRNPIPVFIAMIFIAILNRNALSRPILQDKHWQQAASILDSKSHYIEIPINPSPWKIVISKP